MQLLAYLPLRVPEPLDANKRLMSCLPICFLMIFIRNKLIITTHQFEIQNFLDIVIFYWRISKIYKKLMTNMKNIGKIFQK